MKKLVALVMAMLLLCGAALAEPHQVELLPYTVLLDKVPEGWTLEDATDEDVTILTMYRDAENDPVYLITVAPSETFADYTLNDQLDEKQKANMIEMLTADYHDPKVELRTTDYGTTVICIDENGAETDTVELVTVWHGYFLSITIYVQGTLTEEDVALGMQLMSDLWVVNDLK